MLITIPAISATVVSRLLDDVILFADLIDPAGVGESVDDRKGSGERVGRCGGRLSPRASRRGAGLT
jgi:hypothetical protein